MRKKVFPLNSMQVGEKAIVKSVNADGSIQRRFLDIGIVEGTHIECVLKSPFGDPAAYFIRGALIAIRMEDASSIFVEMEREKRYD